MEITSAQEANSLAATQNQIVDGEFIRTALGIGRTKFYEDLKTGILPPPNFRVGPKKPRWFWSDVITHLTNGPSNRNTQSTCD
jgi:predicted DNA-binding transcriptional regulator AlpA